MRYSKFHTTALPVTRPRSRSPAAHCAWVKPWLLRLHPVVIGAPCLVVPGDSIKRSGYATQSRWRRRMPAVLWWTVGGIFIVAAVAGLIYMLYRGQAR